MELNRGTEFVSLARLAMLGKGSASGSANLASQAEADRQTTPGVARILRAAVAAGSLSDPAWAGRLAEMRAASNDFIGSLSNLSVFDRLLDSGMRRIPLNSRTAIISATADASIVGEGQLTPVSTMSVDGVGLEPKKALALVAVSDELLRGSPRAESTFGAELRQAVATATNRSFLAGITADATAIPSSGITPADVLSDARALLAVVQPKAGSRLFLVTDAITASNLATMAGANGVQAFPDVGPQGGILAGVPLLVADGLPNPDGDRSMLLIDATAIAGETDIVTLDASTNAILQLNTAPVSTAAAVNTSLWQSNLVGLRAIRWFGFEVVRANGVALLTGVEY